MALNTASGTSPHTITWERKYPGEVQKVLQNRKRYKPSYNEFELNSIIEFLEVTKP